MLGELITAVPHTKRKAANFLGPFIEERIKRMEQEVQDYPGKPVCRISFGFTNYVQWLLLGRLVVVVD